ncbi:MAG: cytochrome c3 family protein [Trichloromonas sp.]|nr:cytochrome c3 family protein [Trichloromonas sp.]
MTSIKNTKHDLSSASTGATTKSDNYEEICIFCHTPHKAVDQQNAPLWNRSGTAAITISDYYNSATLDSESQPAQVTAKIAQSDVKLCLSCHDGASLTNDLANPSNLEAGAQPTGLAELLGTNPANIGTDLHDDHPIGMVYADIVGNTPSEWVASPVASIKFYDGGVMWCSSCHDVHDNTAGPFLATSNAASGLCLSCHKK